MPRKIVSALACATVASSLVIGGTATAAPTTVVGKVGPGYSISLTLGGKKVKKLKAGVKYRFVVTDRSEDHDFRIVGPRTNKVLTGVELTGTKVTLLTFKKGAYRFFCAPHSDDMHGSFTAA
jgi:plastocyanin